MSRKLIEQRLVELSGRLKRQREELRVVNEQINHFAQDADDARLQALVSETSAAQREHREARKHVDAMQRHRSEVLEQIAKLEAQQDELLDQLSAG